jgi:hypothetical protein
MRGTFFMISDETSKYFQKFNGTWRSMLINFPALGEEQELMTYLKECITSLCKRLVNKVPERDTVGLRIGNNENVKVKVFGIIFRRRDQFKTGVFWEVLGIVIQSNARFGLSDRLEVRLDNVMMPAGNGREQKKGRPLYNLSAIKNCIGVVKAIFQCLAHALVTAMVRIDGDPKYASYRTGTTLKTQLKNAWSVPALI